MVIITIIIFEGCDRKLLLPPHHHHHQLPRHHSLPLHHQDKCAVATQCHHIREDLGTTLALCKETTQLLFIHSSTDLHSLTLPICSVHKNGGVNCRHIILLAECSNS